MSVEYPKEVLDLAKTMYERHMRKAGYGGDWERLSGTYREEWLKRASSEYRALIKRSSK